MLVAFCFAAAPAQAGVVAVSSAHATINVPSGWTYQRNYSSSGTTLDLYITSPLSASGMVVGFFGHESASGSVTPTELYQEVQSELESGGFTGVTYVVVPRNITIGELPACDVTISATEGTTSVYERVTIAFSSDWHLTYMFVFAVISTGWSSYSSQIDATITSLTVEDKAAGGGGGGISSSLLLALGLVIVVVVVVIVVVLLMMRRKKAQAVPMMPMQQAPPPMPPPPPSS